jgi:ATP-dependent DNA helicase RecG
MPSALETLVKILRLEREQGYKNTAVIGGLAGYATGWQEVAHTQARKPEHHAMIDEISDRLRTYDALENRNERHAVVSFVLDRVMRPVAAGTEPAAAQEQPSKQRRPADNEKRQLEGNSKPRPTRERREAGNGAPEQRQPEQRPPKKDKPGKKQAVRPAPPRVQDDDDGVPVPAGIAEEDASRLDYDFIGEARAPVKRDLPPPPRLARPPRRTRNIVDIAQATDTLRGLKATVDKVRGVGTQTASQLAKVGIKTINNLLFYLPRRYDDYTQLLPIARLKPNTPATIVGMVRHSEIRIAQGGRKDCHIVVDDGSALISVTFFGMGYLLSRIRPHMQVVLRGITSTYRNRLQLTNPEWEELDPEDLQLARIVPIYPLTEGLRPKKLRDAIRQALDYWAERLPDYVPEGTLERADLADLGWTLRNLHNPESWDHLHHAKRRYIFDQLLLLQLAILGNRRNWQATPAIPLEVSDEFVTSFLQAAYPYELTGAQQRAIADIRNDIAKPIPMNRLLQGDVGSGKTAVAMMVLALAFGAGKQAVLMAPTGILAEQHYRNVTRTMEKMPGERKPVVAMLTGSISSAERDRVYTGLADGSIDMVVGTHAIIQQGVQFSDLALAVIDEQHRFGVEQRGALRSKGRNPHLLIMTATPIPRTLALTIHADLDLSVMDEMPPGRIPIKTKVISPTGRERAYEFIEEQLKLGRQAFAVYPLVEASDKIEAQAATEAFEQLQKVFYHHKVGLLHGRMKPAEKDSIMADFAAHKFDVMVTTSVAEVGVDIPNASVILIDGANRFGLAQLHQFRGRVGRGGHASYCLLVCDSDLPEARERLTALEMFSDGFKLAEIDWKLRGAGDLIGTRQSGQSTLQLMDDMSPELVELAQREARTIFEEDPDLHHEQHRLLAQRVNMLRDDRSDLS